MYVYGTTTSPGAPTGTGLSSNIDVVVASGATISANGGNATTGGNGASGGQVQILRTENFGAGNSADFFNAGTINAKGAAPSAPTNNGVIIIRGVDETGLDGTYTEP